MVTLAELNAAVESDAAERARELRVDSHESISSDRVARRIERVVKWAAKLDRIEANELLAIAVVYALALRRCSQFGAKASFHMDAAMLASREIVRRQNVTLEKWEKHREGLVRGAETRHAESKAAKRLAIATYQTGGYSSKDAAAEAMAGNVVPYPFRTVRNWLKGV